MADREITAKLSYTDRRTIDQICDDFEVACQSGHNPDVEQYVAKLPPQLIVAGTIELVLLDTFYAPRGSANNSTLPCTGDTNRVTATEPESQFDDQWQHYVARFPQLVNVSVPEELYSGVSDRSVIDGRFETIRRLASGGLGRVSVAKDLQFNRSVAIKQIHSAWADNPWFQQRFYREAEITGQLEHPGIVPVYVLGRRENDEPYYAMRLIHGRSMLDAIRDMRTIQPGHAMPRQRRQLLNRLVDVCHTVEYAHSKNIIHRDIKPDNIMLGDFGETLLVDWGLAKNLTEPDELVAEPIDNNKGHSKTQSGTVLGTPGYMSPEQANAKLESVGFASDIFSLGATMFHLLTADPTPLVNAKTAVDLSPNRLRKSLVIANVSGALIAICCKALSYEPGQRYPDAKSLVNDIELALADEPIAIFKDPVTTRIRRWIQRHPATSAAVLATASLLFAGLIGISWLTSSHAREVQSKNWQLDRLVQTEKQLRLSAQQAEKRSSRAMDFLVDTLRSPSPDLKGRDVRVVDLLEDSIESLEGDFGDDPLMQARLLNAIGLTLYQLGEYQQSANLLERSRSIYLTETGEDSRLTLKSEENLGAAWLKLGDGRAGDLIENVVHKSRESFGAGDPDTLRYEISLAGVWTEQGDSKKSIKALDRILPEYQKIHGPSSTEVFTLMNELVVAYTADGQNAKAIELAKLVYEQRLNERGPLSLKTIVNGSNFSWLLQQSNRRSEAIAEYESLLGHARKALGSSHYQTLFLIRELGKCYLDEADLEKGIPLIEESFNRTSERYGEKHRLSLTAANSLGFAYMAKGDYEKTAMQFKKAYDLYATLLGTEHPETLTIANNLAAAYRLSKQFDQAVELFETTLAAQTQKLGRDHPKTLRSMVNYAAALQSASRFVDSIPVCREVVELSEGVERDHFHAQTAMSLEGTAQLHQENYEQAKAILTRCHESRIRTMPEHWLRFHTMSTLGQAQTGLKEFEVAVSLLKESYENLLELEPKIPARAKFRVGEAKERLASHYDARNMPDRAAEYRD